MITERSDRKPQAPRTLIVALRQLAKNKNLDPKTRLRAAELLGVIEGAWGADAIRGPGRPSRKLPPPPSPSQANEPISDDELKQLLTK